MTDIVTQVVPSVTSVASCAFAMIMGGAARHRQHLLREIDKAEKRAEKIKFERNGERPVGWTEPEPAKSKQPANILGYPKAGTVSARDPRFPQMMRDTYGTRNAAVPLSHAAAFFAEWRATPPAGANFTPVELITWAWKNGAPKAALDQVVAMCDHVKWDDARSWAGGSAPIKMICDMAVKEATRKVSAKEGSMLQDAQRARDDEVAHLSAQLAGVDGEAPDFTEMLETREREIHSSYGLPEAMIRAKVGNGHALTQAEVNAYLELMSRPTSMSMVKGDTVAFPTSPVRNEPGTKVPPDIQAAMRWLMAFNMKKDGPLTPERFIEWARQKKLTRVEQFLTTTLTKGWPGPGLSVSLTDAGRKQLIQDLMWAISYPLTPNKN